MKKALRRRRFPELKESKQASYTTIQIDTEDDHKILLSNLPIYSQS
jgi:hypothetical protein